MFSLSPVPYSSVVRPFHACRQQRQRSPRALPALQVADGRRDAARRRSGALYIIAARLMPAARPVLCLTSQNGSIGISGIFPQAKLMMMVVVVVERHRCSRFARARVHSRIGLKREIEERRGEGIGVFNPISFVLHFSLGRRPHRPAAVSGEIKIVGRKALRSWCE